MPKLKRISKDGLPFFVARELVNRKTYRLLLSVEMAELRYRLTRWKPVSYAGVQERKIFGWIQIGDERVGALEIGEFRASPLIDSVTFFDAMEVVSHGHYELAEEISLAWRNVGTEIFAYGNIVECRAVWTNASRCPPGTWVALAEELISRECAWYGLLVLETSPLRYDGDAAGEATITISRKRSMKRHFQRLLGVSEFPNGSDWMYRVHAEFEGFVAPPISTCDRRRQIFEQRRRRHASNARSCRMTSL